MPVIADQGQGPRAGGPTGNRSGAGSESYHPDGPTGRKATVSGEPPAAPNQQFGAVAKSTAAHSGSASGILLPQGP